MNQAMFGELNRLPMTGMHDNSLLGVTGCVFPVASHSRSLPQNSG